MERQKVESSNLESVGYDAAAQLLEVEFKNRAVYRYFAIPPVVFNSLMKAQSMGSFFNMNIARAYKYERIDKPGEDPRRSKKVQRAR
jgi:KTSC domain